MMILKEIETFQHSMIFWLIIKRSKLVFVLYIFRPELPILDNSIDIDYSWGREYKSGLVGAGVAGLD